MRLKVLRRGDVSQTGNALEDALQSLPKNLVAHTPSGNESGRFGGAGRSEGGHCGGGRTGGLR